MKVLMVKRLDGDMSKMEIDDDATATGEPHLSPAPQEPELPTALSLAMQLTFAMLSHTLGHPFRRPSEYAMPTLNPYNTIILTFLFHLSTISQTHEGVRFSKHGPLTSTSRSEYRERESQRETVGRCYFESPCEAVCGCDSEG